MDTGGFVQIAGQMDTVDKYTASIDLSNACRQFYKSRLEAAHCIKARWEKQASATRRTTVGNDNDRPVADNHSSRSDNVQRRHRSSIDAAMDKLRTEMVSRFSCFLQQQRKRN